MLNLNIVYVFKNLQTFTQLYTIYVYIWMYVKVNMFYIFCIKKKKIKKTVKTLKCFLNFNFFYVYHCFRVTSFTIVFVVCLLHFNLHEFFFYLLFSIGSFLFCITQIHTLTHSHSQLYSIFSTQLSFQNNKKILNWGFL